MPTFSAPPAIIEIRLRSITRLRFLCLRQLLQLLLRPDLHLARAHIDGLQPVGAGETRIDAAERNGHVGDLLIPDHGWHALQILIRWRAHPPAPWTVVLSGDDKV